jgi:glyoxylase-like metal-dependent hydrolase (beta-lactamase superfamily II)
MPDTIRRVPTDYAEEANAGLDLYLIDGGTEAALVDAGIASTPASGAVDFVARELGDVPLTTLLVTHAHVDHAGGATGFRDAFGCKILVPRDDVGWIEDPSYQWQAFWAVAGDRFGIETMRDEILEWSGPSFIVDGLIRDGDVIAVGDERVTAVLTRAHTPGHTCYFASRAKTVFTGDFVQGYGNPSHDGATVFPPLYSDVGDYLRGLERLARLPFELMATAHRGLLDASAGLADVSLSVDFTNEIVALVPQLAGSPGGVTVPRLAGAIAEICGAREPLSVQSVTTAVAHLRHAARDGSITNESEGVWSA